MLYVFYGNDVIGVRQKAREFLNERAEDGSVVIEIEPENYSAGALKELAGGTSLFSKTELVLIDTLSTDADMFDEPMRDAVLLAGSSNTFVVIETALTKEAKERLGGAAEKMTEMKRAEEKHNAFALSDALLAHDKKSLWILLEEARRRGMKDEEIIGTLLWQVKMLRLAERTKSGAEAGVKPFVFTKAKQALTKFKRGEPDRLSRGLIALYHDGHAGKRDLPLALEEWVLTL